MTIHEGEVREVGIEVINQLGQDFLIEAAEYLMQKLDGSEVEKGMAMIQDHKILTLIKGRDKGRFYVVFKYHIGAEILKAKIFIEVI